MKHDQKNIEENERQKRDRERGRIKCKEKNRQGKKKCREKKNQAGQAVLDISGEYIEGNKLLMGKGERRSQAEKRMQGDETLPKMMHWSGKEAERGEQGEDNK